MGVVNNCCRPVRHSRTGSVHVVPPQRHLRRWLTRRWVVVLAAADAAAFDGVVGDYAQVLALLDRAWLQASVQQQNEVLCGGAACSAELLPSVGKVVAARQPIVQRAGLCGDIVTRALDRLVRYFQPAQQRTDFPISMCVRRCGRWLTGGLSMLVLLNSFVVVTVLAAAATPCFTVVSRCNVRPQRLELRCPCIPPQVSSKRCRSNRSECPLPFR